MITLKVGKGFMLSNVSTGSIPFFLHEEESNSRRLMNLRSILSIASLDRSP